MKTGESILTGCNNLPKNIVFNTDEKTFWFTLLMFDQQTEHANDNPKQRSFQTTQFSSWLRVLVGSYRVFSYSLRFGRLAYELDQLLKQIDTLLKNFDAELRLLRHDKFKLDIDLKNADLRYLCAAMFGAKRNDQGLPFGSQPFKRLRVQCLEKHSFGVKGFQTMECCCLQTGDSV